MSLSSIGGLISDKWFLLLETMYRLPTTSVVLVLVMAIAGGMIVNHILKVGFFTTLASIPLLLLAGLLGNAVLIMNHVILTADRASNTALAASFGFIAFAAVTFGAFRIWHSVHDRA